MFIQSLYEVFKVPITSRAMALDVLEIASQFPAYNTQFLSIRFADALEIASQFPAYDTSCRPIRFADILELAFATSVYFLLKPLRFQWRWRDSNS